MFTRQAPQAHLKEKEEYLQLQKRIERLFEMLRKSLSVSNKSMQY